MYKLKLLYIRYAIIYDVKQIALYIMKCRDLCEIQINQMKLQVEYLGKGRYSTVYRDSSSPDQVFIRTHENDYTKEVLSMCHSVHLPKMNQMAEETARNGVIFTWWKSVYVKNIVAADTVAWKQAKILQEVARDIKIGNINAYPHLTREDRLVQQLRDISDQVQITNGLPDELKEAVESLTTWMLSYSAYSSFEFNKPNLGVDKDGRLILRDVNLCVKECERTPVFGIK